LQAKIALLIAGFVKLYFLKLLDFEKCSNFWIEIGEFCFYEKLETQIGIITE